MKAETGHIIGATYHSKYWGKAYKVLRRADVLGGDMNGVTVEWSDGHITTHCTHVGDSTLLMESQHVEL